jgi:hypothetical protein
MTDVLNRTDVSEMMCASVVNANGLVRSFSQTFVQGSGQPSDESPSRKALDGALVDRIDFEDAFAALLGGVTTRFEACTSRSL